MPSQTAPPISLPKPDPDPSKCSHDIPESLNRLIPGLCPVCKVEQHIKSIKSVQAEIAARGGIFASRPRTSKHEHDPNWKAHLDMRKRWRDTKVAALNDVMTFEGLEEELNEKDKAGLGLVTEAIKLWDQEAETLADVPGYRKELSREEVDDLVKLMLHEFNKSHGGAVDADGDSAMGDADMDAAEEEAIGDCPFPDSDVDSDLEAGSEDEDMADSDQETNSNTPDDESDSDGEDEEDIHNGGSPPPNNLVHFPDGRVVDFGPSPTDADEDNNISKTILKRGRVRFTEYATVSPQTLNFVPSFFPHDPAGFLEPNKDDILPNFTTAIAAPPTLSSVPKLQRHRHRTDAAKRSRRRRWYRGAQYKPGQWKSPPGYEKADTSCYRKEWPEAELHWLQLDLEMGDEKKVHDKLKEISGSWVRMRSLRPALSSFETSMTDALQSDADGGETST